MSSIKNILVLAPILWIRKVLLYLIIVLVGLGLLVYFLANSPLVIKKLADTFAPDYNITYSRIHGNVLTGVEIDDLAFSKQPLAKKVTLKWNPSTLVKKQIRVNKVLINTLNVDTIKTLTKAFSSPSSSVKEENTSSEPFAFSVLVEHISVTLDTFVEQNITISNLDLNVDTLHYASDGINVGMLKLLVDSNITTMELQASLEDGVVNVENLTLKDIDTEALEMMFASDSNESNVSRSVEKNETTNTNEAPNPLIPHLVKVDTVTLGILPRNIDPVELKSLSVVGSEARFNVKSLLLETAMLEVNAKTNLSDVQYKTNVKDNILEGKVKLTPQKALFELYNLPLRQEAIGDVVINLHASKENVIADIDTSMKNLLKPQANTTESNTSFNVDIDQLKSHVTFDVNTSSLIASTTLLVSSPYAKNVSISNDFRLNNTISYSGDIKNDALIGVDAKFTKPLNHLNIHYNGDDHSVVTKILSDGLVGSFVSDDFKKAVFHLASKKEIVLNQFLTLPAELNQTKAKLSIDAPISFDANSTLIAQAKIRSNVVNIDANVSYKDAAIVLAKIDIPEKSLLKAYSKELKWKQLTPIHVKTILSDAGVNASLKTPSIKANVQYDLNTTGVKGLVQLGGLKANISGVAEKKITLGLNIDSIPSLLKNVSALYPVEGLPKIRGKAKLSAVVSELKNVELRLTSPKIVYVVDVKTKHKVEKIDIAVDLNASEILLKHYQLTYNKEKFFATKPSKVTMKDDVIGIQELWLNDSLKVQGKYHLKTKKGKIDAFAEKLHIAHEIIDLDTKVDIKTILDGNATAVNGKVVLLGGDIHYDMGQKSFASDSDIVIVQNIKKEEKSPFMENLSADIQVLTKRPLVYNQGDINMKASVDLGIHKAAHSELMVLGTVTLLDGGSYTFEGKRFVLDESYVHFTGDPSKPLLEITVKYKSVEHLVTIRITGSASSPNIAFSSKPSLSKEQILSLILFDTEGGAGTNSGEDMMKMMGGAMAKSALSNVGIKLDHLVLGEGNSVEVGKKLTDKITIIYVNGEVAEVKMKYQHSKRTESVIGASEVSQSYDIVYKRDF